MFAFVQLKSESSEVAAAADSEQLETLRTRVRQLQKAVDDAEYKHQMAARQQRRGRSRD